jgi:hypothetical protein
VTKARKEPLDLRASRVYRVLPAQRVTRETRAPMARKDSWAKRVLLDL